jgi:hypothetical protein
MEFFDYWLFAGDIDRSPAARLVWDSRHRWRVRPAGAAEKFILPGEPLA